MKSLVSPESRVAGRRRKMDEAVKIFTIDWPSFIETPLRLVVCKSGRPIINELLIDNKLIVR
jgi:hypothetical protein